MKKFILLILATTVFTTYAVNLWEGSCSFTNWNVVEGDERPVFTSNDFTNAVVGDKLVLTISAYGEDSWRQAQLFKYADGWPQGDALVSSPEIPSETQSVEFTFDDALLETVKASDICLAGTGYTVTSVELTTFDGVVWEGECVCENWNASPAVNLPGSAFVKAQEGDILVFTLEVLTPGAWAALQVNTSNWTEGPFGQTVLSEGQTEVQFVLDATLLESLTTEGIDITGANFKLTKIELVKPGNSDGDDDNGDDNGDDNDGVIWTGSMKTGDGGWDNTITLGAGAFAGVKAGDNLEITVSEAAEGAQIAIRSNPGWGDVPSDLDTGDYISLSDVPGEYYFPINQEGAEEISENGLVITSTGAMTITKLKLIKKGGSSGVEAVEISTAAPVFNLQGIKVAESIDRVNTPGLYICSGKKYLVK